MVLLVIVLSFPIIAEKCAVVLQINTGTLRGVHLMLSDQEHGTTVLVIPGSSQTGRNVDKPKLNNNSLKLLDERLS